MHMTAVRTSKTGLSFWGNRYCRIPFSLVFVYAVIQSCGCGAPRVPHLPTGDHVTLATYNINYGGFYHPDRSVAAIREADADIICLQETNDAWEYILRNEFSDDYPYMAFQPDNAAGGMGIMSKYPIQEREWRQTRRGWFHGWVLEADTNIGNIQLLNVHLKPSLNDRGGFSVGAYLVAGSIRESEINELHEILDPKIPTVILGDFNEAEGGRAMRNLLARGYTDALSEFDTSTDTWEWQTSMITFNNRLDHVMYSPQFYCANARVIKLGSSDHFPVVTTLQNVGGTIRENKNN